ncbi:hypothetical protein L6164_026653 [Bauhinia variegata]|uniref:Uncharacterized protein n=1 Tax=Bauhinia variegata TaxID=167791 RepID=A0ACB9LQU9_BAUVA|nr:hypothetical protein L6164_026653 [Bauhinia variegata]
MKKRMTLSPIDMVYEILAWLPAKSLMRFKGISKFWKSTIEYDSFFIQLHRRRSRTRIDGEKLLFHLSRNYFREHKFISIDKEGERHITEYNSYDQYQQVLVLDGFVCFYSDRSSTISASLCNLSTREFIALPKDSNFNKGLWRVSFLAMGFDSSHTLCKILHKTKLSCGTKYKTGGFEVYKVGDPKNCWRIINSPPFECHYCDPCNHGNICINGVIFWFSHCGGENKCYGGEKITAFDVSDESFHLISIPHNCYVRSLRNVDGVPTLMDSNWLLSGFGFVKLWKLKDYKNQVWVVEKILIDIELSFIRCWEGPNLIGTNCSGEILMIQLDGMKVLISSDRARGISKVVELGKLLPRGAPVDYRRHKLSGYTFVENIMPLKPISN